MAATSKPTTLSTLTGAQQQVAKTLANNVQGGLQRGATAYDGQLVAALNPNFQNLLNLALDDNAQGREQGNTNLNLLNTIINRQGPQIGDTTQPLSVSTRNSDYFQKGFLTPLLNTYENTVRPLIDQQFAAGGRTLSAGRGNAQARALTDLVSSAQQQFQQQAFGADVANTQLAAQLGLQRNIAQAQVDLQNTSQQQNAVGLAQQQTQNQFSQYGILQGLLNPIQQNDQNQLTAQYNEFLRTAAENNPYVQQALGLINTQQLSVYNKPTAFGNFLTGLDSIGNFALGGSLAGATIAKG